MLVMVSITFSIPENTRKVMKEFPEVNWTHIVRSTIEEKVRKLELKREMLKRLDSPEEQELTRWSVAFGRRIKQGRFEKLKKKKLI